MEFTEHTFEFAPDYDGRVVSTLLSYKIDSRKAVLYVHGYCDYFFQEHMAEWFNQNGYNFYAVDLRKYGRSLLEGQHPNFCRSLSEYYEDITASLNTIAEDGNQEIVLLGHSTGGLIASLYAKEGKSRSLITKLVLNSPFFEFNTSGFKKTVILPIAGLLSKFFPFLHSKPELSPYYAQSIHKEFMGEWNFDKKLKPIEGFPLYFSWLAAIKRGQRKLHNGLSLTIPVLVMCSSRSFSSNKWSDDYKRTDTVLNVDHIVHNASRLGSKVQLTQIECGMHDLFLSSIAVRTEAFEVMKIFIDNQ